MKIEQNNPDKIMGDYWVIVVLENPEAFVMLSSEVRKLIGRKEKDGKVSYWLGPTKYDKKEYRNAWKRIGRGDEEEQ